MRANPQGNGVWPAGRPGRAAALCALAGLCLCAGAPSALSAPPPGTDDALTALREERAGLARPAARAEADPNAQHVAGTDIRDDPLGSLAVVRREYLFARAPAPARPLSMTRLRRLAAGQPGLYRAHLACARVLTPRRQGTGFFVAPGGRLVTSFHLVAGADRVLIQTLDGRTRRARAVAAFSEADDLVLLDVEDGPRAGLEPADLPANPAGTRLYALGHPGGRAWELTEGAAIRRLAAYGSDLLHFDAPIERGSSGGPILDADGRVLGVVACTATLADGSTVKVGASSAALRRFLRESPGGPCTLEDVAAFRRRVEGADFLLRLYLLGDRFAAEYLGALPGAAAPAGRSGPLADAAAKVFLLVAFARGCGFDARTPGQREGLQSFLNSLDELLGSGAALVRLRRDPGGPTGPDAAAVTAACRSARASFARSLDLLDRDLLCVGRDRTRPADYAALTRLRGRCARD